MASILTLQPTTVGPRDVFTVTLNDGSLDFTVVGQQIGWLLVNPSGGTGALYHRIPNARVVDARTVELIIDSVGPNVVTQVPQGRYTVVGRIGFWEGNSNVTLQVVATSQTRPPPPPPSLASAVPRGLSTLQLLRVTMPWRARGLRSRATVLLNAAGQHIGMRGPLFQVSPGSPPPPQDPTILPLIDGENVFPAIADVIRGADHFCYLAVWGLDESVRLTAAGQNDPPSAQTLLREQSVAMARLAEARALPRERDRVHGDVRVLVWDATLDDDFLGSGNDIGNVGVSTVRWRDVRRLRPRAAAAWLRDNGHSGESRALLAAIHGLYRRLLSPPAEVVYPSGVLATTQNHPTAPALGSHHQKFCVTENNAYVGGLNLHRDYWDTNDHTHADPNRDTSHGLGSGGSGAGSGPLHDCGAIIADAHAQRRLREVFALRWDDSRTTASAFAGYLRAVRRISSVADPNDDWVYQRIVRELANTPRALVGGQSMRVPMTPQPVGEVADHLWVNLTMPAQMPGFDVRDSRQILAGYRQIFGWLGAPPTLAFIESQYFDHKDLAERLLAAWQRRNGGREDPMVHIVIPYKPQTHAADPVFWRGFVRREFRHLRWCEIHSMREMLELDAAGNWVTTHTVRADTTISVQASMDTLQPDTEVHFTNLENVNGARIARLTRRVREFMTRSGIVVYTLAKDDAPAPSASDATDRQRDFLLDQGIYIHSKTAILIDEHNTAHTSATVGSANLTPRSLDDADRDSEINVWWRHHDRIRTFYERLVAEHTGGPTTSFDIQELGLQSLNEIRSGATPGRHLVRLDLADRYDHLL